MPCQLIRDVASMTFWKTIKIEDLKDRGVQGDQIEEYVAPPPPPALNKYQIATGEIITEIFETGGFGGSAKSYGRVTVMAGDSGHLTYGKHQATLMSGSLYSILLKYIEYKGMFAQFFANHLSRFAKRDLTLDTDKEVHKWLRYAGADMAMQQAQDFVFNEYYRRPALNWFDKMGMTHPLSYAVVYDSIIHGSWTDPNWGGVKMMTDVAVGKIEMIGEQKWIVGYLKTRRNWLANHRNKLLHKTVYRMDELLKIANTDNWALALPMTVRGLYIALHHTSTEFQFNDPRYQSNLPVYNYSAQAPTGNIFLKHPYMSGPEVFVLEKALSQLGFLEDEYVDTIFNEKDMAALRQFQYRSGLSVDGIAGPMTLRKIAGMMGKAEV